MGISINTNVAANRASYFLSKNHTALQKSLDRLSSGKRITQPSDDAGGLAVAMKLDGSISRLQGASSNVSNAISFLQVQDGLLESAGNIVARMGELKGLYADVLKSTSDQATYDSEFNDLTTQLFEITKTKFNGNYVFGDWNQASDAASTFAYTDAATNAPGLDVAITEDGSSGAEVTIHRSLLGSAMNVGTNGTTAPVALADGANAAGLIGTDTKSLATFDTAAFTKALENVATLRARNGGQVSRLMYAQDNVESQITNMTAAYGRIMDVDVAQESANLAKQQILVQASAAKTAQAKSSTEVALMLLQ
jgi:flagellin